MVLHTVNKSPYQGTALSDCLERVGDNDVLILIENAVYAATQTGTGDDCQQQIQELAERGAEFYVLEADLLARGLQHHTLRQAFVIASDRDFVKLSTRAQAIQSWY